ncbi:unnamed protein product [Linum tenue]|uniref:S-protein homolog n=1 Tax=Linum tenue TaxID=586396 RepID=A0AAV0QB56_9ROSI|nr:unnamed protein product [Linum tenue]
MPRPSLQHTVHVANKLRDKTLIVHCRSKDDNLEAHAVGLGESFQWSFEPNALGGTLFWCDLAVQDKRLTFAAFEQIGLDQSGPYTGHWYVRGDGVYGKDKSADDVFFKAAWRRVWPRR